jgi:autotransporter-associated beta strand protein
MAFGVSAASAASSFIADYTTFTLGGLATQNSWAQVSGNNTATPIQVIAAASPAPQSIKVKGVASAAQAYRDLPTAFNPVGAASTATFYYVIENLRVIQAYNSSSTPGVGSGICALTSNLGGTGTYLSRLYVRRYQGSAANTGTFDLGLNPAGAGIVYGATALSTNTSYKIVVEYTANPAGTLDVVKVYVNPVGLNPANWTAEISQTIATDPTVSAKSFVWTPGAVASSTINEFTASKLLLGDTAADVLAPAAPVSSAATNVVSGGFTANWAVSTGATGYNLDVATDAAFTSLVTGYSNLDVSTATSQAVTGTFTSGQTLYYRVRARSAVGASDNSGVQNVSLPGTSTAVAYTNSSTSGAVDWSTVTGWDVLPVSEAKSTVNFIGALTSGLSVSNNATFTLNGLNVANTGSGTVAFSGGNLTFATNTAPAIAVAPLVSFTTAAAAPVTVANGLVLGSNTTFRRASTAGTVSIDGVISGSGSLIKSGNGSITIAGTANTFSGGVSVSDNELRVNTLAGSIGSGNIILGNGTTTGLLRWGDSFTATTESSTKTITLPGTTGGGTLDVRGANELTLNGAIDTGSDASSRALQFTGNGQNFATGYSLVVNGLISGNARLRINGSGARSVVLANANNSFTGGVTLDGNISGVSYKTYVTKIGNSGALSPLGTNGTINIGTNNTGGAFNFLVWTNSSNETTDKTINLSGTTNGALINNKGTALLKFTSNLTVTGNGTKTLYADQDDALAATEFAGSIFDSAAGATLLNKNGNGTLVLSAANTFTGGITVKGGTLQLSHASALASGNVSFTSNGVGNSVVKLAYSGNGSALRNLLVQRNAKIDLGTTANASITFATATGWTAGTVLTVSNSATGKLYIVDGAGLDLTQVVSLETPAVLATRDAVTGLISFAQGDTQAPVITLKGSATVSVSAGSSYTDAGATATDNVDTSVTVTTSGTVDTATPGVYTVTYNATDAAGNAATPVTRTVTVSDTTAPVITLTGSATASVAWGSSYTDAGATATDNVDLIDTVNSGGSVNANKPGTYTLTFDATDAAGNVATQVTRTVTVAISNPTTVGADGYSPVMKYAFGANSPSDTVQAPVTSGTATTLSVTAVVRTNDSNLVVTGEAVTDLAGTWGTGGTVTVTSASDQSNLPANCARKVFTVDTTGAAKKFLRLKVVGTF